MSPPMHQVSAARCQTVLDALRARGYVRLCYGWARLSADPDPMKRRALHRAEWVHTPDRLRPGADLILLDPPSAAPHLQALLERARELDMPITLAGSKPRRAA